MKDGEHSSENQIRCVNIGRIHGLWVHRGF